MAKKSFLMVSLEEDKAKKLAQVISNDKCRKILDYLTNNDSVTESEIAEELNLPLSTVHYNIQQLVESNLVRSDEYHYSKKGKEVQHYSLVNKYIIISPKPVYGIKQKLKSILPVVLIVGAAAATIRFFAPMFQRQTLSEPAMFAAQDSMENAGQEVLRQEAQRTVIDTGAAMANDTAIKGIEKISTEAVPAMQADYSFIVWFIAGALFALLVYLLIDWIRRKRK